MSSNLGRFVSSALPTSRRGRAKRFNRFVVVAVLIVLALCLYKFGWDSTQFIVYPSYSSSSYRQSSRQRSPHIYRADGLVDVNPDGAHPILELVARGRQAWAAKLERQSRTLEEAVSEYVRRYGRQPPKGFDIWWKYVQDNGVQLPDEYDSINDKLKIFWGVDPKDLQKIEADWELSEQIGITIGKQDGGPIEILRNIADKSEKDKANQERPLRNRILPLRQIEDFLPDFHAVASPGDNPNLVMNWNFKERLLTAAATGEYLDLTEPEPNTHGWLSACSPDSPANKAFNSGSFNIRASVPESHHASPNKTFIWDHRLSMDPCLHPTNFLLVGQFIAHLDGPGHTRKPTPQFSFSPSAMHYDLPLIPFGGFGQEHEDISWEEKSDERLLWRGGNTGMRHKKGKRWEQSQRPRLVGLNSNRSGTFEILAPAPPLSSSARWSHNRDRDEEGLVIQVWDRSEVAPLLLDVAYAGKYGSCDLESCQKLVTDYNNQPFMSFTDADKYKYILDVDGHAWSNRFRRLMLSNSLIFKATVYPEWFTERVQPWAHYIPVSVDYSDLLDALMLFRGDFYGNGRHDELAREIAVAGKEWAQEFFRLEDGVAYMFRFLLEYIRVMSTDRDSMNYSPASDDVGLNVQDT